jgi:hypothetical protein
LDVSKNSYLKRLGCNDNSLTSLDVSKNSALRDLYCYNNPYLYCIQVVDSIRAVFNSNWQKDSTAYYSENCNYTGVEDNIIENNSVSVFPNPAADFVEVDFGNVILSEAKDPFIIIYNLFGEKVLSSIATPPDPLSRGGSLRIDISGLAAGVYFIRSGNVLRSFIKI